MMALFRRIVRMLILVISGLVLAAPQTGYGQRGDPAFPAVSSGKGGTSTPAISPAGRKKSKLNIQGYRIGMTPKEVRKILANRGITGYETAFSDLYVYQINPDAELSLSFSCTSEGDILSGVQLETVFNAADSAYAIRKYRKKLRWKYGRPSWISRKKELSYCWGQCRKKSKGTKLAARTTGPVEGKRKLIVSLENESLTSLCIKKRRTETTAWIHDWIRDIQKFRPGMTFKAAEFLYVRRYSASPIVEAVPDSDDGDILMSEINDNEFFTDLGSSSRLFEGDQPGQIILRFTGEQAGRYGRWNGRLFYSFFSTTGFKYNPLAGKQNVILKHFSQKFGKPDTTERGQGSLIANWTKGRIIRKAEIFESGLINLEQTDNSIKEAYRNAVAKEMKRYNRTRFNKEIF